jgi:hypothetical protein
MFDTLSVQDEASLLLAVACIARNDIFQDNNDSKNRIAYDTTTSLHSNVFDWNLVDIGGSNSETVMTDSDQSNYDRSEIRTADDTTTPEKVQLMDHQTEFWDPNRLGNNTFLIREMKINSSPSTLFNCCHWERSSHKLTFSFTLLGGNDAIPDTTSIPNCSIHNNHMNQDVSFQYTKNMRLQEDLPIGVCV